MIHEQAMEDYEENDGKAAGYVEALEALSPREIEVLELIGKGYTYKQAAAKLALSVHTIHTHVKHIKEKLRINGYRGLVPWYRKQRQA